MATFCNVPSTLGTGTGATGVTGTGSTGVTGAGSTGVTGTGSTGVTGASGTAIAVNCTPQGATSSTQQNIQFSAEARVPASFVLAPQAPVLPTSLFNSIMSGTAELRQFVALSGQTLTFDLLAVPTGTSLPFSASLPTGTASLVMPTGTLINEVRIQVQNVTVTSGLHPTMLFSGIVTSGTGTSSATGTTGSVIVGEAGIVVPSSGTGEPGSPLVPNLFGNLNGNAASVSLAFNETFAFPGIGTSSTGATTATGSTGATSTGITGGSGLTGGASSTNTGATGAAGIGMTGGTGTSMGNTGTGIVGGTVTGSTGATSTGSTNTGITGSTNTGITGGTSTATGFGGTQGTNGAVPVSMLSVTVAGAFDLASPTGFATVGVTSGSTTGTTGTTGSSGATGTTSTGPVIQLAPFNFQTSSRSITLDASASSSPNGALTFSWTSVGQTTATIAGATTATPTVSFAGPGTFQIQLTVTDATGASCSVIIPITVMM